MAGGSSQLSRSFWAHVTKAPFTGSFTALQQESPGAVRGPDRRLTSNRSVRVMLRRGFSPNCPVTALPVLRTTLILFVTHFQTIQEKENGKVGLEKTPSLINSQPLHSLYKVAEAQVDSCWHNLYLSSVLPARRKLYFLKSLTGS